MKVVSKVRSKWILLSGWGFKLQKNCNQTGLSERQTVTLTFFAPRLHCRCNLIWLVHSVSSVKQHWYPCSGCFGPLMDWANYQRCVSNLSLSWLANREWLFNRPILVHTQILVHRWGATTEFHRRIKPEVSFVYDAGYFVPCLLCRIYHQLEWVSLLYRHLVILKHLICF